MSDIFITGDRSVDPLTAIQLAIAGVQRGGVTENDTVYTGSQKYGVERAVRYLLDAQEVLHVDDEDGKPDFTALHKQVAESMDTIIFVHTDPLNSKIGASLVKNVPAGKLIFVTPN